MKKLNYLYLGVTATLFIPAMLYAFPPGGPGRMVDRMQEKLNLTDEQAVAVEALFVAAKEECDAIDSRSAFRDCMKDQKDGVKAELQEILTEEQFEKMKEARKERAREILCEKEV